jgi:hypothetical protein
MRTGFWVDLDLSSIPPGLHWLKAAATDVEGGEAFETVPFFAGDILGCFPNKTFRNYGLNIRATPQLTCQPAGLDDIVSTILRAESEGKRVHAVGSHWSFSECALPLSPAPENSPQVLIETRGLNRMLPPIDRALVSALPFVAYVQAGITIEQLYSELNNSVDPVSHEKRPLALETMPASTGQTVAGAISTGSHGGDLHLPPLADSVLAVHLVGAGGTQYWIEPSSGITNPSLLSKVVDFGATGINLENIIYDDHLFDAVLVSLGCMGIIYGLVLRVREQYTLTETTRELTWQEFAPLAAAQITARSNHFLQILINPYPDADGENKCLVTTREENVSLPGVPCRGDIKPAVEALSGDLEGYAWWRLDFDALQELQHLQDREKEGDPPDALLQEGINYILRGHTELRDILVKDYFKLVTAAWPTGKCGGLSFEVMDTGLRGAGAAGRTVGVDTVEMHFASVDEKGDLLFEQVVNDVLAEIAAATDTFFAGYVSLRFTSGSRADLAMQQWPDVCAVEISTLHGIDNLLSLLTRVVASMYEYGGLPHWGQLVDLVPGHNAAIYPRFADWREAYARLSDSFSRRTFENDLSVRWQLTVPDLMTAMPIIRATPSGTGGVLLEIIDATPGATIFYTVDGSQPSRSSNPYVGEFEVEFTGDVEVLVQAIAVASGYHDSGIASTRLRPKLQAP